MVSGSTISTYGTVSWIAKGLAFPLCKSAARNKVTFLCGATVRVATASSLNAGNQRITLKTRWTVTNGSMEINFTVGPSTTYCGQARVNTFLGFACFVKRTIIINLTLN